MSVAALATSEMSAPAVRDRFLDLLRAASIAVVVLGHYTIAAVERRGDSLYGTNALSATPWLRALTWIFQVMPLFFFVGGFTNARSLARSSSSLPVFIGRRARRLATPAIVFVATWVLAAAAAQLAGADPETLREGARIAAQPLWFLAVYLVVIALAPAQFALHRRHRWVVPVTLPLLVGLMDVLRLTGAAQGPADVNYVFVFLAAQELGFWYADGALLRLSARQLLPIAAAAGSLLILLTTLGPYPVSMVGVPGQRVSNMSPPTMCILLLTIVQVSVLIAVRRPIGSWLQRDRVWRVTVAANGVLLTVFLWHLTAFVVAAAVFAGVGLPLPTVGTGAWWATKPLWLLAAFLLLTVIVMIAAPIERKALFATATTQQRAPAAWTAIIFVAAGMCALAATGFTDVLRSTGRHVLGLQVNPLTGIVLLAVGWLTLHATRTRRQHQT